METNLKKIIPNYYFGLLLLTISLVGYNFCAVSYIEDRYKIIEPQDTFMSLGILGMFSALILAPFLEEFIFRYTLSKSYKYGLIVLIIWVIISIYIMSNFVIIFSYICIISVLILLIHFFTFGSEFKICQLDKSKFIIFWLHFLSSSIVFCLAHVIILSKYDMNYLLKFLITLIVFLPLSLTLATLRYKKGMKFNLFLHSLHNLGIILVNSIL